MRTSATSIDAYLAALPEDRRCVLQAVRTVILRRLPAGYEEMFLCGMLSYVIPLSRFAQTYNGQPLMIASLGAQKNHLAVYLMCIYGDTKQRAWFETEYRKSGKKLDAGKACVRFKTLDDLPVELVGEAIARVPVEKLIEWHERAQAQRPHKRPTKPATKSARKKPVK